MDDQRSGRPSPPSRYPFDSRLFELTDGNCLRDLWIGAKLKAFPGYRLTGKVFDRGSRYGIGGGRISKLRVYRSSDAGLDEQVIHYDRGWVQRP